MIASQYKWTIGEMVGLTLQQLNKSIERINQRIKKEAADQAYILRLAISGALTKEGDKDFKKFIDKMTEDIERKIKPVKAVTSKDLARFGMGERK